MSLITVIAFVLILFAVLGLLAWTIVSISLAITHDVASSPSTAEVVEDSRELVGQHAG